MAVVAKVSSKGQVVIPAEYRKKLRITRLVVISEEGGRLVVEPTASLEDAFGVDGGRMTEVAREISMDRRAEVEPQRT
ncbi:MAG: AbrB/MazE/SpoVT family DNA-binding domain-containing protein [Nitrososphaerota archaeon]|jgi:AbrB family looped-hinge helix DNA binding protein|nr:AbrB/MazE/SpoVT family DNA-binding domain-containing protein [Nitrososphaerota archaeon]MDG6900036.1 AbrB/MazE/SpoVT family DNA-binding domain-containing protein [Nitrososphaerota archaeon]MDG6909687.1 AbrB/MazE/SpoVT family DNA-binding domain-containing protein [Nitrososphaerota archaeon]MDG6972811.1 AbrB/MazE/SpoVT family DNA-binding domain-containing protein [Nitrososphaerota archaeon]MDG6983648.1 AbrB/MazE/SpoVT family DNA-binding domain-containing protein [Nitrososphaerota archaeon]